jgi:integrase
VQKLTDGLIKSLKLESGRKDRLLFDTACPGLGVRLTVRGTRTFLVQWTDRATGRKVREPLGVWGNLTVEQARPAARAVLGAVAKGGDPRAERQRQSEEAERRRAEAALSFDTLVTEWAELHLAHRRPRYAAEAPRALRYSLKGLMKRPAARITRAEAVNALDALVKTGRTAMASRTLAYARACYRWAEKRGKVPSNPFHGLPIPTASKARDRVLSDAELAEVWAATERLGYPWGPFFKFAILTLQRREEVAGMRWSEISTDLSTWAIPASRMKNGKPHDVHLAEPARAVLRSIPRMEGCDFAFSTTGETAVSGFSKAKIVLDGAISDARARLTAKAAVMSPWRLHDLRRTGVSTLARLGFDSIVADKLLAHQPAKLQGVAAVYQRHDFAEERARALDAWARHVLGMSAGNVFVLRSQ